MLLRSNSFRSLFLSLSVCFWRAVVVFMCVLEWPLGWGGRWRLVLSLSPSVPVGDERPAKKWRTRQPLDADGATQQPNILRNERKRVRHTREPFSRRICYALGGEADSRERIFRLSLPARNEREWPLTANFDNCFVLCLKNSKLDPDSKFSGGFWYDKCMLAIGFGRFYQVLYLGKDLEKIWSELGIEF